jgi:hypothetical protein
MNSIPVRQAGEGGGGRWVVRNNSGLGTMTDGLATTGGNWEEEGHDAGVAAAEQSTAAGVANRASV